MMPNSDSFCATPIDLIANPDKSPSPGTYGGEKGYPQRDKGDGPPEKIYDKATPPVPADDNRGTKA
jgi:hypothetical protein